MTMIEMDMEWTNASEIDKMPEYHSTSMRIVRLLVCIDQYDDPVIGWYFPKVGWRVDNSPSVWKPTHFMPMPKKPGAV